MGRRKRHRFLTGILEDATSNVKATLSAKHKTAGICISVAHATAHGACDSPSEKHMATVISFGHGSGDTASKCIVALMDRLLHGTKNACVALKCLFAIHSIVVEGSFIGSPFTLLSAGETSLTCRSFATVQTLNKDLLREIDVLVNLVETTCEVPDSLHRRRNTLIYEVIILAGEDYRRVQLEMSLRVVELGDSILELSLGELAQLLDALKILEDWRERSRL